MLRPGNGTLQQYLLIDSSWPVSRKPASITFADAAALPLVYSTVYDALVTHGKLPFDTKEGELRSRSVLILGGTSRTGSVAIQLAKKMGLKVVTTCSTRNVDFVTGLGADGMCISTICLAGRQIALLTRRSFVMT